MAFKTVSNETKQHYTVSAFNNPRTSLCKPSAAGWRPKNLKRQRSAVQRNLVTSAPSSVLQIGLEALKKKKEREREKINKSASHLICIVCRGRSFIFPVNIRSRIRGKTALLPNHRLEEVSPRYLTIDYLSQFLTSGVT